MPDIGKKHKDIKQKVESEMKRYVMYTLFLTLFFAAFTTYERLLLNFHGPFFPYGYSLIQGLIMAKVIMIGQTMKLGERYDDKPLIVPVLHKTLLFCLLMIVLIILEHLVTGCLVERKSIELVYEKFISRGLSIVLAKTVIVFFIFVWFFAVMETSRVLGGNKLFNLFFKSRQ
jgi:hypothetical protein